MTTTESTPRPPDGDWLGTPFLRFTREGPRRAAKVRQTGGVGGQRVVPGRRAVALCSDMAVVSDRATFRVPELFRGIADTYYNQMLARIIGPVRTRDLMFTGRTLTAQEALDWGMVARVVPHDGVLDAGREVLGQCCRTAPAARGVVKASLDNYLGLFDRIGMQASLGNPEAVEGFVAFKERRSPSWVHPELRVDGRI